MPRDFAQIPDGGPPGGTHVMQIIESWMGLGEGVRMRLTEVHDADNFALKLRNKGAGGKHQQIRKSDDSASLFEVTDGGVLLSAAGEAAGHALLRINMGVLWFGTAANVPSGWSIVMAGRFPYGASVDGDLGATGGSDAHTHTSPNHSHTTPNHSHTTPNHSHPSAAHSHVIAASELEHDHGGASGDLTDPDDDASVDSGGGGTPRQVALSPHFHSISNSLTGNKNTNSTTPGDTGTASPTTNPANPTTNPTAATVDSTTTLPPYERCYFLKRTQ